MVKKKISTEKVEVSLSPNHAGPTPENQLEHLVMMSFNLGGMERTLQLHTTKDMYLTNYQKMGTGIRVSDGALGPHVQQEI